MGAPAHIHKIIYVRYGVNAWFHGISPKNILHKGIETCPRDWELKLLHEVAESLEQGRPLPATTIDRIADAQTSLRQSVAAAVKNAGSYDYNQRDYATAERLYASSLKILPNAVGTIVYYANTLLDQGRLDDALTAYRRMYAIGPPSVLPSVIPGLQTLLGARPDKWEARMLLAHAYIVSDNLDGARQTIETGPETERQKLTLFGKVFEELERVYRERGDLRNADGIRDLMAGSE